MTILDNLNDKQKEAVLHTEGPLLILAGAGSGKTRVLTHRIAYLIEEKKAEPYEIMAITFTNKAAEEMRNRVAKLVPYGDSVWIATFHSTCVRILRRFIETIGYGSDFTIYDTDDAKTAIRQLVKEMDFDPKVYKEKKILSRISHWKNNMVSHSDAMKEAESEYDEDVATIYEKYDERLKKNNALDFDDLLLKSVEVLKNSPSALLTYQKRFKYIMVDEYQDTNLIQFELIYLLSKEHKNLAVVGDDDQSIYRFRGADIRNILEFEQKFPGTKIVKLEQNYRSTENILNVANAVIRNNHGRKEKHLWSNLGKGEKVTYCQYFTAQSEAEAVICEIRRKARENRSYSDFAVLYRTNAQSRLFEEKCLSMNVPYTIVGGVDFYQRAEVKDMLAYLKTIASGRDDLSVRRILNVPKRGIGDTTVERLTRYAAEHDIGLMETFSIAENIPEVKNAVSKLHAFAELIHYFREEAKNNSIAELLRIIVDKTDYTSTFDNLDEDKAIQKEENIEELISKAAEFEDARPEDRKATLQEFLEEVALIADIDNVSDSDDRILLMTMHSSKGLEFPVVYLCGMEEGVFPSFMSISDLDPQAIEDERRLAYVGMTRAREELHLTSAEARMQNGETDYHTPSRFIDEIPKELLDIEELRPNAGDFYSRNRGAGYDSDYSENGGSGYKSSYSKIPVVGYGLGYSERRKNVKKEPESTHLVRTKGANGELFQKVSKVEKAEKLDYKTGDRVVHVKFGEGIVRSIKDGNTDYEVEVDFDRFGTKRLYASFAKLKKADS